jgi:hypothetical protein
VRATLEHSAEQTRQRGFVEKKRAEREEHIICLVRGRQLKQTQHAALLFALVYPGHPLDIEPA